ncbi:MAG TPA: hypothetical protein VFV65_05110 [Gemmatimonadales bacterium]|nr:hypothetical protein [Gemmatimonadales bacterium]
MTDERPLARPWEPAAVALSALLPRTVRGPKREGVFALWLTVRVALDFGLTPPLPDRASRRRLTALERRLASLTLPAPLRRALTAAMDQLRPGDTASAALALTQLVAPVRDTLGGEAADAIALAARVARTSAA